VAPLLPTCACAASAASQVIGYDMDYTLVQYKVKAMEAAAYRYAKEWLRAKGFAVSGLAFQLDLVCRGLIVDKERGNLLKARRGSARD